MKGLLKYALLAASFSPAALPALEILPWFNNVFEFELDAAYTYSHYTRVQGAIPKKYVSNDQEISLGLGLCPSQWWSFDVDAEFVHTRAQPWGFRSAAAQARTLWLDDVLGDLISLNTGFNFRYVAGESLHDVSCPYHANYNAEATIAIGKEWDQGVYWRFRPFVFAALGMAERGSPWMRALAAIEGNRLNRHQLRLYALGYFGFGKRHHLFINHFDGYAHIHHQSIDLGLDYSYLFDIWGSFSFEYCYRVYARLFPERTSFVTVRYTLPFSLF
jgi:hypothetical protein